ncbi:hypothetical protein [Coleofasciculus sp. G2-EDA-02]|uniref:hypothetical protein n=1 Tax=Coleofasciculus sp. G2-EDA-02 TaxID=3069529 RepID=UPI003300758F
MADLTLIEQCGAGATISSGVLTIVLSQVGIDSASPTTSQILGALVLKRRSLMTDALASDPTVGCSVGEPLSGLTTRGSRQQSEQQYLVSLYRDIDSQLVAISDPDDISI